MTERLFVKIEETKAVMVAVNEAGISRIVYRATGPNRVVTAINLAENIITENGSREALRLADAAVDVLTAKSEAALERAESAAREAGIDPYFEGEARERAESAAREALLR